MDDEVTLLDRFLRSGDTSPASAIFMLLGLIGLLGLGVFAGHAMKVPWQLDASSPVTTAVGSECNRLTGGSFVIEVDGETHVCTGSDTKCGFEGAIDIAYDADDPASCRVAAHVDGLSAMEQLHLVVALAFSFVGLAGLAYRTSEALRMRDLAADEPRHGPMRTRLRRATWVCLALAAITINLSAILVATF